MKHEAAWQNITHHMNMLYRTVLLLLLFSFASFSHEITGKSYGLVTDQAAGALTPKTLSRYTLIFSFMCFLVVIKLVFSHLHNTHQVFTILCQRKYSFDSGNQNVIASKPWYWWG